MQASLDEDTTAGKSTKSIAKALAIDSLSFVERDDVITFGLEKRGHLIPA